MELENLQQKGGRKKQRGHVTYSLKEADDGWETISDAQNAAATLAMFKVQIALIYPPPGHGDQHLRIGLQAP